MKDMTEQDFDQFLREVEQTHYPLTQALVNELYDLWLDVRCEKTTEGRQHLLLLLRYLTQATNTTRAELVKVVCRTLEPSVVVVTSEEERQRLLQYYQAKKP